MALDTVFIGIGALDGELDCILSNSLSPVLLSGGYLISGSLSHREKYNI